jgi:2-methylcitrate dehydratase PrpD
LSGRALLTAFAAGAEVMIRIGRATKHSNETRGFHAPGTTGPFGAAVACGHLIGFDAERMTNALGIAGSLSSGLVEFARSGTARWSSAAFRACRRGWRAGRKPGGRRLHRTGDRARGRLRLSSRFTATTWMSPSSRAALGETWLTQRISMKRYACHTACHTPVQAIVDMKANERIEKPRHPIDRDQGRSERSCDGTTSAIRRCHDRAIQRAVQRRAGDHGRMHADPRTFRDADVNDQELRSVIARIRLVPWDVPQPTPIASRVTLTMRDGRLRSAEVADFKGTPDNPLNAGELRDKAMLLTRDYDATAMTTMFNRLQQIEDEANLDWICA